MTNSYDIELFPTYDELKDIKEHKVYHLFESLIGGYFRLVINENGKDISIDYIDRGFITPINYNIESNYELNKLYNLNKKNYQGLISLYKKIIKSIYKEIDIYVNEINNI